MPETVDLPGDVPETVEPLAGDWVAMPHRRRVRRARASRACEHGPVARGIAPPGACRRATAVQGDEQAKHQDGGVCGRRWPVMHRRAHRPPVRRPSVAVGTASLDVCPVGRLSRPAQAERAVQRQQLRGALVPGGQLRRAVGRRPGQLLDHRSAERPRRFRRAGPPGRSRRRRARRGRRRRRRAGGGRPRPPRARPADGSRTRSAGRPARPGRAARPSPPARPAGTLVNSTRSRDAERGRLPAQLRLVGAGADDQQPRLRLAARARRGRRRSPGGGPCSARAGRSRRSPAVADGSPFAAPRRRRRGRCRWGSARTAPAGGPSSAPYSLDLEAGDGDQPRGARAAAGRSSRRCRRRGAGCANRRSGRRRGR